jgi:hypothetical protein
LGLSVRESNWIGKREAFSGNLDVLISFITDICGIPLRYGIDVAVSKRVA